MTKKITTESTKREIIRLYEAGMSPVEITRNLRLSSSTAYLVLRKQGHHNFASYELDEGCFSANSEGAMYFGGLLMADGCLTEIKPGKYNLYLDSSDMDILEKYRIFLGSPRRKIQKRRDMFRVQVSNDQISKDVQTLGIVPRKSAIAEIPERAAKNRHYWRGIIDGDGWYTWNNRNTAQVGIGSASRRLVEQFTEFLNEHGLYKGNQIYERKDTVNPFFSYVVRGGEAFDLIDILYFDSGIWMNRKREKAMEFMYNRNRW